MKKLLVFVFALSMAGSLYAGGGCCTRTKTTEKSEPKIEEVVVADGTCTKEAKDCDTSDKKCDSKDKS
jgi:hypothetical protein